MEYYIHAIAGSVILITVTGFCPMENILEKVFKVPR